MRRAPGVRAGSRGVRLVLPVFCTTVRAHRRSAHSYQNSVVTQCARRGSSCGGRGELDRPPTDRGVASRAVPWPRHRRGAAHPRLAAVIRMTTPFAAVVDDDMFTSCDLNGDSPVSTNWTTKTCANHATGDVVSVRVRSTYTALTPILSSIRWARSSSLARAPWSSTPECCDVHPTARRFWESSPDSRPVRDQRDRPHPGCRARDRRRQRANAAPRLPERVRLAALADAGSSRRGSADMWTALTRRW